MNVTRKYIVLFLSLALLSTGAAGQKKVLPEVYYHLTEQNGLSDNQATCFFKDSRGIMWIGTGYGLNSFDGSSIQQYHPGDGLSSDVVAGIDEDGKNQIWIATDNALTSYDLTSHRFTTHPLPANFPGNAHFMEDLCIHRGIIYTAGEAGLISYDPGKAQYTLYPISMLKNEPTHRQGAMTVIAGTNEDLWLGTYNGLWHFDIKSKQFDHIQDQGYPALHDLVSGLCLDHNGILWVGAWSSGIVSFDPHSGLATAYPNAPTNARKIVEQRTGSGDYQLWLTAGLTVFDEKLKVFQSRLAELLPQQANKINVTRLYSSKDGLIWIGTERGIYIYDPSKQYFTHYFTGDKDMTSQGISFYAAQEGLYIGAASQKALGLYDNTLYLKSDFSEQVNRNWSKDAMQPVLSISGRNDTLYLGTGGGLLLFDKNAGKITRYVPSNMRSRKEFISSTLISSSGDVYCVSWRNGLWKLNIAGKCLDPVDTNGNFSQLREDRQGNIWLSDLTEGLLVYDKNERKTRKVAIKGMPQNYVLTNIAYRNDTIWGVSGGIFAIDTRSRQSYSWPAPFGMNKSVSDFIMDPRGNIWISSKSGLIAFDKDRKHFVKYVEGDGLVSNDMNGSFGRMNDGRIIYGAENYFTVFDPSILLQQDASAPLYLEEIRVNGKPVTGGNSLQLRYSDKNINFSWALLHYDKPFQTRYYCKLEGVDDQWRDVGTVGYIQYNSLQPGNYTFFYRAISPGGVINESRPFSISISPPFWKTWWFIVLAIVLASAVIYSIYRYRLEQVLKLERLRMKISTDLHDDIGSTLSSISILSDIAMREPDKLQAEDMLQEIKENSLNLMDKMDDIVWSINPKHDSLEQLLLRMKRLASKVFEAKKINYSIDIHDSVKEVHLPMQYRQHIYLVIKEAINNIVKHSQASRAVIDVSYRRSILEVVIRDNGIGFDSSAQGTGNGLMSMSERAKMLNTRLDLESKNNEGTSIVLRVKIA